MYSCLNQGGKQVMNGKTPSRFLLKTLLAAYLSASLCFAQQITGSVTGAVTDPTGAAVVGAAVKLTNTQTGAVQNATTNGEGDFRFLLLPTGNYSLEVTSSGFKSFRREGVIVEVDRSIAVPVALQV